MTAAWARAAVKHRQIYFRIVYHITARKVYGFAPYLLSLAMPRIIAASNWLAARSNRHNAIVNTIMAPVVAVKGPPDPSKQSRF